MKNQIIIENQYFGCVNYYLSLLNHSNVKIESCEWYQKMSFRNRCIIYGSNGLITLSVPLQDGRNQRKLFKDVKIDYSTSWHKQHWKSIQSVYGKSPYFEYYGETVKSLLDKKQAFLFDMNIDILNCFKKLLKIPSMISLTTEYKKDFLSEEISDLRNKWLPKNYQEDEPVIVYRQPFEMHSGFQRNLSILDFLFNEGPYLFSFTKQH